MTDSKDLLIKNEDLTHEWRQKKKELHIMYFTNDIQYFNETELLYRRIQYKKKLKRELGIVNEIDGLSDEELVTYDDDYSEKIRNLRNKTKKLPIRKTFLISGVPWVKPEQKKSENKLQTDEKTVEKQMENILKNEKSVFTLHVDKEDKLRQLNCTIFDKQSLPNLIDIILENNISPSVRIQLNNKVYCCHLIVLQCFSDFFAKCGNIQKIILPLEYVTDRGFRMFYRWCLSGKTQLRPKTIVQLLKVAKYFRVRELIDQCHEYIIQDSNFKEEIAFKVYLEAREFHMDYIAYLMLTRIGKFFLTMVACSEFLYFTPTDMNTILGSDNIAVNSESEILFSLVRWLDFRWEIREKYCLSLLKKVRFGLMPPWFLYVLMRGTATVEVDRVIGCPEVELQMHNSMIYAMKRGDRNLSPYKILKPLKNLDSNEPNERKWVNDQILTNEMGPAYDITYESFLKYLSILRMKGLCYWKKMEHDFTNTEPQQKQTEEFKSNVLESSLTEIKDDTSDDTIVN